LSSNLVIVESPGKVKSIKKYLGKDFEVLASYGHVRDLVPKEGAVDPEHRFAMKYQVVERNQKHIDAISRALKKAKSLYLATDPDREGEAISWHLYELLKAQGELKGKDVRRVVFYEITKNSVQEAIASPRELSVDLVNAQQARRALDFLVGFNLSPLLWKKVRPGLSAGRVQSPALRMICEREDEIAAFVAREYWSIDAELEHSEQKFPGKLVEYQGAKVEQFSFTTESQARDVERTLQGAAKGQLTVLTVDRKQRKRNPAPPFTTSTLQQEAARKLGFSAQKTMRVAQQLYEGVDIGEGQVGLITYMRTDSLNLAQEAIGQIRDVIVRLYGSAGRHRTETRGRSIPAVFPDLEAHRGLPNGPGDLRYRGRGNARGRGRPAANGAACQRLHLGNARLHLRVSRGDGRRRAGRLGPCAAADEGRRSRQIDRGRTHAAFHRAAAAVLRGVLGQGARGIRHRPAVDLRVDHFHVARSSVRRHRKQTLHRDGYRQDRQPLLDPVLHDLRGLRFHGKDGGLPRCRGKRRAGVGSAAGKVLETVHRSCESYGNFGQPRGSSAGPGLGQGSGERQADDRAHGAVRALRADRHQGRCGQASLRRP